MPFKILVLAALISGLISGCVPSRLNAPAAQTQALKNAPAAQTQALKVKSYSGKIDLLIPPRIYTRADLMAIAANSTTELHQAFLKINWLQSGAIVTLDNLPQGKLHYAHTEISGFNKDATNIQIAYTNFYEHGSQQVLLSTWDIESKTLQRLIALPPGTILLGASPNLNQVAVMTENGDGAFFDAQSGQLQNTFFSKHDGGPRIEPLQNHQAYSPDGRYLSATFYDFYRNSAGTVDDVLSNTMIKVFQADTGKLVQQFSHSYSYYVKSELIFAPDSSSFFTYWTSEYAISPDGDRLISVGNLQKGEYDRNSGFKSPPQFSGDSKYLATADNLYGLEKKSMVEGYKGCRDGTSLGVPIPNSLLNIDLGKNKFQTIAEQGCVKIRSWTLPNSIQNLNPNKLAFSKDLKKIASLVEDDNRQWRLHILPIMIPNQESVTKAIVKNQKSNSLDKKILDKKIDEAQKMFEAGFPEEALSAMNDLIEQNAENPSDSGLIMNYILSWARDLPLIDVGKAYLRQSELIFKQPKFAADGFLAGKKVLKTGFSVGTVMPQSNADKAGLKTGDIILEVDGIILKNENAYNKYIKDLKPGRTINLTVKRNAQHLQMPLRLGTKVKGSVWGFIYLANYGTIASAAGHPDLTLAVANKLKTLSFEYRSSVNMTAVQNFVVALESLSMASTGDSNGAYNHAIKNGGFVNGFSVFVPFHITDKSAAQFIRPLFKDRKKLAYLVGMKEDELPATPTHIFPKQPYIDLDGNTVSDNKTVTTTKPGKKKKPKIQVLDE